MIIIYYLLNIDMSYVNMNNVQRQLPDNIKIADLSIVDNTISSTSNLVVKSNNSSNGLHFGYENLYGGQGGGEWKIVNTDTNSNIHLVTTDTNGAQNNVMVADSNGNVGIGTIPNFNLDVRGNDFWWYTSFRYFHGGENLFANNITLNTKIYTDGYIVGYLGVAAVSDSRIKNDIVEINDEEALVKLRLLKPCKYKYKDRNARGDEEVYGFIAQEVKEVLPYAVKILPSANHIPNVYQGGTYTDGIITMTNAHGLTENGEIKLLVTLKLKEIYCPFTIIDNTKIQIDTSGLTENIPTNDPLYDDDGNLLDYNIFVYGIQVDDFHALKKDYIWATGISALQEVDRQLQAEKAKVTNLETQVEEEKAKTATLETQVADLLTRVTALENP